MIGFTLHLFKKGLRPIDITMRLFSLQNGFWNYTFTDYIITAHKIKKPVTDTGLNHTIQESCSFISFTITSNIKSVC